MAKNKEYTVSQRKDKNFRAVISRKLTGSNKQKIIIRATKADAIAEAEKVVSELRANGADFGEMPAAELRAARIAMQLLADAGFDRSALTDAVAQYVEDNDPKAQKKLVKDVIAEYIASKRGAGLSAVTERDYRQKFIRFEKKFGSRYIHKLTAGQIEEWLNGIEDVSAVSRKRYRSHVSMLFKFAIRRQYTRYNPVDGLQRVRVPDTAQPIILTVKEAEALLNAAVATENGIMVPYFAVSLFAGLRPGEAQALTWDAIDLVRKELHVGPKVASKTKRQRFIEDLPDNVIAWLRTTPKSRRKGCIAPPRGKWKYLFDKIRDDAGLKKKWKSGNSICRHTCASYLLASKQNNTPLVSRQCGHSIEVLERNYLHAVKTRDAEKFFSILPPSE